jgi:hypothetical protein
MSPLYMRQASEDELTAHKYSDRTLYIGIRVGCVCKDDEIGMMIDWSSVQQDIGGLESDRENCHRGGTGYSVLF